MKKVVLTIAVAGWLTGWPTAAALARDDAEFIDSVLSARVIELNFLWGNDSPLLPVNPPYRLALHTSHRDSDGCSPGSRSPRT